MSITRPNPGESVLEEEDYGDITVQRLPDDRFAIRLSLGRDRWRGATYCVFRGPREDAIAVLERALVALREKR